jgi:hypothetical protein
MRWVVLVAVAGCAHGSAVPRIEVGDAASARVGAVLAEHRGEVLECFDEMAVRRGSAVRIRVGVEVQVRDGGMAVASVRPLDPGSITDTGLLACLADRLARWRVGGDDAELTVPLAVAPRISDSSVAANLRAAEPPRLVPAE